MGMAKFEADHCGRNAMARSEAGEEQALWYGRMVQLVKLTGQVEEADLLWRMIAPDMGACTRAYLTET